MSDWTIGENPNVDDDLTEKEQFDAALRWVEKDLGNVVDVGRISKTEAEFVVAGVTTHGYSVVYDETEGWGVYRVRDGDQDSEYLEDGLSPWDAVGCAIGMAVQDALCAALGFDGEINGG